MSGDLCTMMEVLSAGRSFKLVHISYVTRSYATRNCKVLVFLDEKVCIFCHKVTISTSSDPALNSESYSVTKELPVKNHH